MKVDPALLRRLRDPRPVPSSALTKTGREFWLQVIVEFLARGGLSNN